MESLKLKKNSINKFIKFMDEKLPKADEFEKYSFYVLSNKVIVRIFNDWKRLRGTLSPERDNYIYYNGGSVYKFYTDLEVEDAKKYEMAEYDNTPIKSQIYFDPHKLVISNVFISYNSFVKIKNNGFYWWTEKSKISSKLYEYRFYLSEGMLNYNECCYNHRENIRDIEEGEE